MYFEWRKIEDFSEWTTRSLRYKAQALSKNCHIYACLSIVCILKRVFCVRKNRGKILGATLRNRGKNVHSTAFQPQGDRRKARRWKVRREFCRLNFARSLTSAAEAVIEASRYLKFLEKPRSRRGLIDSKSPILHPPHIGFQEKHDKTRLCKIAISTWSLNDIQAKFGISGIDWSRPFFVQAWFWPGLQFSGFPFVLPLSNVLSLFLLSTHLALDAVQSEATVVK